MTEILSKELIKARMDFYKKYSIYNPDRQDLLDLCETALALHDKLEKAKKTEKELRQIIEIALHRLGKEFYGELNPAISALQTKLDDIQDTHDKVINEKCPGDEVHCTCVPFLRREIADIKASILAIRKSDCGAWLKSCSSIHFHCSAGESKRHELRRLLDKLYVFIKDTND